MIQLGVTPKLRLTALDFGMSGLASMLAVYSTGMALGIPTLGFLFAGTILAGTIFSYLIHRGLKNPANWEAVLYAIVVFAGLYLARRLNTVLPEGGFPIELMVGGILSWMLVFGSFVAWRDHLLLFQAVPSIALFGLVGSWDTFVGAPVAFFAFLMCIATFFAKVHARAMLRQAASSGYAEVGDIQSGPWRWMAGPEWALASAAAVIMISLIGAPIIRESVKGVTNALRVRMPIPASVRNRLTGTTPQAGTYTVGTGPIELSDTVALLAKLDRARYLRANVYDVFQGRSWTNSIRNGTTGLLSDNRDLAEIALNTIQQPVEREFAIDLRRTHSALPVPAEVVSIEGYPDMYRTVEGGYTIGPNADFKKVQGSFIFPQGDKRATDAYNDLRMRWSGEITPRVAELARQVTKNATNDMEKALAIKREIERRCVYNLNAQAVPPGRNAVDYFLFDSQEGYCDLFATAMTVMAKSVDLPARYATGYFPFFLDKRSGWYVIRSSDAHAWSEILFEGAGWVTFDTTEGADVAPGSERGGTNAPAPWYLSNYVVGPVAAAAFVGVGLAGVALRRRWQARARISKEGLLRSDLATLYLRFERMLEKRSRRPRRPGQTLYEYVKTISPKLGPAEPEARRLTDGFVQTLYGQEALDSTAVSELREQLAGLRALLKRTPRAQG